MLLIRDGECKNGKTNGSFGGVGLWSFYGHGATNIWGNNLFSGVLKKVGEPFTRTLRLDFDSWIGFSLFPMGLSGKLATNTDFAFFVVLWCFFHFLGFPALVE